MFWAIFYGPMEGVMAISIGCKDLGIDCPFEAIGESKEGVLDLVMRHMRMDHKDKIVDWFEIEEIYQAVCKAIYKKAV
jgi:predicted small metal-binding protein